MSSYWRGSSPGATTSAATCALAMVIRQNAHGVPAWMGGGGSSAPPPAPSTRIATRRPAEGPLFMDRLRRGPCQELRVEHLEPPLVRRQPDNRGAAGANRLERGGARGAGPGPPESYLPHHRRRRGLADGRDHLRRRAIGADAHHPVGVAPGPQLLARELAGQPPPGHDQHTIGPLHVVCL